MRLALAQINTSMGAIEANCARMSRVLTQAEARKADLTIFPELALIGYPPTDLIEQTGFLERSWQALDKLSKKHKKQAFVVGFVEKGHQPGKGCFNAAAYVAKGKIQSVHRKSLLPTYDIFDEARYFDSGTPSEVLAIGDWRIGLTICEDIWTDEAVVGRQLYPRFPARESRDKGANLIVNISASPYHAGKEIIRHRLAKSWVAELGLPFVLVNLVGGNDDLLFDGGSFIMDSEGEMVARCRVFEEDLVFVDLDRRKTVVRDWPKCTQAWQAQALSMGIRDYVHKCGFKKVLVGLSGGIDSALTVLLATEALGAENVMAVFMPSPYTSVASQEDVVHMVKALDIGYHMIPITEIMQAYDRALAQVFKDTTPDVTEENIQARARGNILMALSNKFHALVLSTGNKSELAVGYCTQYGDMAGGLAVISDVPKEGVYALSRFLNEKYHALPQRLFNRPPSAELRPDQKDQDSLPPYEILDPILRLYIEDKADAETIVKAGYDRKVVSAVIAMVDHNEFKRRQAAPGLRLSSKAFGLGRRMPIARRPL